MATSTGIQMPFLNEGFRFKVCALIFNKSRLRRPPQCFRFIIHTTGLARPSAPGRRRLSRSDSGSSVRLTGPCGCQRRPARQGDSPAPARALLPRAPGAARPGRSPHPCCPLHVCWHTVKQDSLRVPAWVSQCSAPAVLGHRAAQYPLRPRRTRACDTSTSCKP